jgi:hypothetical protein
VPTPFRAAVEAHDMDAAIALLREDVVFRSPAVHTPYEGRAATGHLLRHVEQVFADFRYVDEIDGGDRIALVFEATVGDKRVSGLDLLRLDEEGRVAELTVMVRPLSGLVALATAMGERLERDPVPR